MPKKSESKKPAPTKAAKKAAPKKAKAQIKEGYFVKVEYTGTFEDGEVFDSTELAGCPLEFQVGAQQVIDGFEKTIVNMELNEEKHVKIQPADAYGEYQSEMTREIPRDRMPAEKLEAGITLMATLPHGQQVPVTITAVTADKVTIDMNHPLAGKVLNFKIKLVEVREGELSACAGHCRPGCSCG